MNSPRLHCTNPTDLPSREPVARRCGVSGKALARPADAHNVLSTKGTISRGGKMRKALRNGVLFRDSLLMAVSPVAVTPAGDNKGVLYMK